MAEGQGRGLVKAEDDREENLGFTVVEGTCPWLPTPWTGQISADLTFVSQTAVTPEYSCALSPSSIYAELLLINTPASFYPPECTYLAS